MSIRKIIPVILVLPMAGAILAVCMNDDSANARPDPTATALRSTSRRDRTGRRCWNAFRRP